MYAHNRPLTSCAMDRDGSDFVASGTWQISDCPITTQSLELRVMTELARARGAEPPPAVVIPPARRSLLEIAIENSVEGCVRECWGASCARFPGRCGTAPRRARGLCAHRPGRSRTRRALPRCGGLARAVPGAGRTRPRRRRSRASDHRLASRARTRATRALELRAGLAHARAGAGGVFDALESAGLLAA